MLKKDPQIIEKVDDFFASYPTVHYKKGESILRAEDTPYGVYFLKSGFVRQYVLSPSGETFIVHMFKPGSFFPLTWVLNDTPNSYNYEAVSAASVVRVPKDVFVTFLKTHPGVLWYATQRLAAGISGLATRVGQLVLDDAYIKTVLLLLYYKDIFGEPVREGVLLRVPLAHREIASWIGTTRETASLQVEALKKKGIIKTQGRLLVITDLGRLQIESQGM